MLRHQQMRHSKQEKLADSQRDRKRDLHYRQTIQLMASHHKNQDNNVDVSQQKMENSRRKHICPTQSNTLYSSKMKHQIHFLNDQHLCQQSKEKPRQQIADKQRHKQKHHSPQHHTHLRHHSSTKLKKHNKQNQGSQVDLAPHEDLVRNRTSIIPPDTSHSRSNNERHRNQEHVVLTKREARQLLMKTDKKRTTTEALLFRKLKVTRLLGRGSFGDVYLVACLQLNHPNIIQTIEIFETQQSVCILMELGEAGDLYDALHSGILDCGYAGKTCQILLQILAGLEYLHVICKYVHCDIKSENIILTSSRQAKICDLVYVFTGACRTLGCWQRTINGTAEYLCPTLALELQKAPHLRKPYQILTDIDLWAFGILCFYILTHEKAWTLAHPNNKSFRDVVMFREYKLRPWVTFNETVQVFFESVLHWPYDDKFPHLHLRKLIKTFWPTITENWRTIHAISYV
eukprot:gene3035-5816_t